MTGEDKIKLMHNEYGLYAGKKCKTCRHLISHSNGDCTRRWYKCCMFGLSNGTGTDWRTGNDACGAYNISRKDAESRQLYGAVYRKAKGRRERKNAELEGQMNIYDFVDGGSDEQEN